MANELNQTTEKLHKCQLLLASELKRLCEKHNIKYYMIAGTLLGAVRHKGFIPWDDDMDFAIMRCDYARFLKVCKAELGEDFVLQEMFIDKNYALPMAKLLLKGTVLAEYTTVNNKALKGIGRHLVSHIRSEFGIYNAHASYGYISVKARMYTALYCYGKMPSFW